MVVPFNADRHDHIAYVLEGDGSALPEELAACLRAVACKEVTTAPAEVHFSCVVRACLKLSDKAHPLLAVITTRRFVALQPNRFPTDLAKNVTLAAGVLLRPFLAGRVVVRGTHPLDTSAAHRAYPLVPGSWQRINLAAAMSAKVKITKSGAVKVVSTGGKATVVR